MLFRDMLQSPSKIDTATRSFAPIDLKNVTRQATFGAALLRGR